MRPSLRDRFAFHAPLTYEIVKEIYGGDVDLTKDSSRAAFFAVWSLCAYEFADAMLYQRGILKDVERGRD